jgi:hypothetical protein
MGTVDITSDYRLMVKRDHFDDILHRAFLGNNESATVQRSRSLCSCHASMRHGFCPIQTSSLKFDRFSGPRSQTSRGCSLEQKVDSLEKMPAPLARVSKNGRCQKERECVYQASGMLLREDGTKEPVGLSNGGLSWLKWRKHDNRLSGLKPGFWDLGTGERYGAGKFS